MDLQALASRIRGTALEPLEPFTRSAFLDGIRHGDFRRWRERLARLPALTADEFEAGDVIRVGRSEQLDEAARARLEQQLLEFIPWRKGPFNVFGVKVDSEWRSEFKWRRLQGCMPSLRGKTVLDAGCGNGYYAFRMAAQQAELVIGVDQHIPYVMQFWAIKGFLPELPVFVAPIALEALPVRLECFDVAFSMGVIYHARSPIDHLLRLGGALKPGGKLILETLYVDGEQGYSLTPATTYARMSNVWFIPGLATLAQWLRRSEFVDIEVANVSVTASDEQRRTKWMPWDSFDDSLDPADPTRTVEGLPAPKRAILTATRS